MTRLDESNDSRLERGARRKNRIPARIAEPRAGLRFAETSHEATFSPAAAYPAPLIEGTPLTGVR